MPETDVRVLRKEWSEGRPRIRLAVKHARRWPRLQLPAGKRFLRQQMQQRPSTVLRRSGHRPAARSASVQPSWTHWLQRLLVPVPDGFNTRYSMCFSFLSENSIPEPHSVSLSACIRRTSCSKEEGPTAKLKNMWRPDHTGRAGRCKGYLETIGLLLQRCHVFLRTLLDCLQIRDLVPL